MHRLLLIIALATALSMTPAQASDAGASTTVEADTLFGGATDADWLKAVGLYRAAADAGDGHAMAQLGIMYEEGKGVPQDIDEAVKLYRGATERGDVEGIYRLGLLFQQGRGVNRNLETARSYFTKAAKGGLVAAMTDLAKFYLAENNFEDALAWLEKAADASDAGALTQMGLLYRDGNGVEADANRAAGYFRDAIDAGSVEALVPLAGLYESGNGVTKDQATADDLYRQAAEAGVAVPADTPSNGSSTAALTPPPKPTTVAPPETARSTPPPVTVAPPELAYSPISPDEMFDEGMTVVRDGGDGQDRDHAYDRIWEAILRGSMSAYLYMRDYLRVYPELCTAMQQRAKAGGFYFGALDGDCGDETADAIAEANGAATR